MRVLFLNQYFPPDPAPTGILFQEIATALRLRGHEVHTIDARQQYREGQGRGSRLAREFGALLVLLIRGIFCRRADVVVSGSSPPCLAVVGALVSLRHWSAHLHWCMDVYPEIAVALREVRSGFLVGLIRFVMKLAYRRARVVVALDADMVHILSQYGIHPLDCRPWVPAPVLANRPTKPSAPGEVWTWLYSGNLGRAHDWQTLLAAQASLEERGIDATLVFQGGGPARAAAVKRAEELNLKRVVWRPYAPEADLCTALLRAHCLVVTQLPEARGLLWPSKLALLLGLPRPLLFVGPAESAAAALVQTRSDGRACYTGDFRAVADWIQKVREEGLPSLSSEMLDIAEHRTRSIDWWVDLVERAGTPVPRR